MNIFGQFYRRIDHRALEAVQAFKTSTPYDLGACHLPPPPVLSIADLKRLSSRISGASDGFFAPQLRPKIVEWYQNTTTLDSGSRSGEQRNDRVRVHRTLPMRGPEVASLIVIHHWNGRTADYSSFCQQLAKYGIASYTMDLPFHGERSSRDATTRTFVSSEMLSSNLGRTIKSFQQATADVRMLTSYVAEMSNAPILLAGVSLGSAIGALACAHSPEVAGLVSLLPVADLSSVVWNGAATLHIREGCLPTVRYEDLHDCWSCISPATYRSKILAKPTLAIIGKYDEVAPPDQAVEFYQGKNSKEELNHELHLISSGHHSLSLPWNALYSMRRIRKFVERVCATPSNLA